MGLASTTLDWDRLVEERNAWVAHNFPDPEGKRTPLDSVLGVIEELGELVHHHLKQVQAIRGLDHFHVAEAQDAIGDLTVYLLGVMSYHDIRPFGDPIYSHRYDLDDQLLELTYKVGRLAYLHETGWGNNQAVDVQTIVTGIIHFLRRYCLSRSWDYDQIVQNTWNHVRQRDWRKFPHDGLTR